MMIDLFVIMTVIFHVIVNMWPVLIETSEK